MLDGNGVSLSVYCGVVHTLKWSYAVDVHIVHCLFAATSSLMTWAFLLVVVSSICSNGLHLVGGGNLPFMDSSL